MTDKVPFDLWLVPNPNDHWLREYMQLVYDGAEGQTSLEFSRSELEDLKEAIAAWEIQYYGAGDDDD